MSQEIVEEPLSESYDFYDAKNEIIVTLYANGTFEVKDIDIAIDTDSLEIRTPGRSASSARRAHSPAVRFVANECWIFRLYEHIYSDRVEIDTTINGARTQTSIEIRLFKQQPRTVWPQLYCFGSIPITPQRDGPLPEYEDVHMIDQQQFELSAKKIKNDFFESNEVFTAHFYLKNVRDCQVHFTETNFTATFYTE